MPDRVPVEITVNGIARSVDVEPHHTLLDALRDDLGLTGAKSCCLVGECGACTVMVDGRAVDACLVLAAGDGRGRDPHGRGARAEWRGPVDPPVRLPRARRRPVRLLHPGPADGGPAPSSTTTPAPTDPEIEEGLAGKPVPVRVLRADLRRRPGDGDG
jgi:carbon-monoxide dehydrogenase small subunit